MLCPQCGAEASAGSLRCAVCGLKYVTAGTRTGSVQVLTPPPDTTSAPAADMRRPPGPVTAVGLPTASESAPTGGGAPHFRGLPAFSPGGVVAGRYHIIRLLGAGGMGAVYQAWDDTLGVSVALKVILPPDAAEDVQATESRERRFKRELLLARQVTHKNVVRIHDFGEVDGTPYISMPYVQGANLNAILSAEGRLPVERTLHLARQIAAGLTAAHEAGVVHRDLKPANIMIEGDDRALIMDFGIARSTETTTMGTRTGGVVGTLEYMAPEQAQGQPVDQRCDVYAFGLIVFDMLTGGRRAGASAVAALMERIQKPLPSLRSVNPSVPEPLAQIIDHCLQRDASERYQTSAELVAALEMLDEHGQLRSGVVRRGTPLRDLAVALLLGTLAIGEIGRAHV